MFLTRSGIEELKARRGKVQILIDRDETESQSILKEIENLTGRLNEINEKLKHQNKIRCEYDRIISESESAFMKVWLITLFFHLLFPISAVKYNNN